MLSANPYTDKFRNFTDKFILFIKLVRKYAKKLKGIMDLINKSNENPKSIKEKTDYNFNMKELHKENLLLELLNTIEKFNVTIHNQQLIDNILDSTDKNLNSVTKKIIEEFDKNEKDEMLKNKELIQIIEQLEFQIKKLNEKSESCVLKHKSEVKSKDKFLFIYYS